MRDAIAEGKKILVLINPPYAEATSADNTTKGIDAVNKSGVAKTKFAITAMSKYGKASNELFTQFVARIALEIPTATVAMFSKMKYVNSQTLDVFRNNWNAKYLGGFVVDSKSFDGLKGNFPIGFLVWKTNQLANKNERITEIEVDVLNKKANPIGAKIFYNISNDRLLTNWIDRPKANKIEVIPLKNCISPATATLDLRGNKWADGAIAYFNCPGNETQQTKTIALFSSGCSSGRGYYITNDNLWQAAIVFSVRRLIKPTWLNDRDQFLIPTEPLTEEFKNDCLIWMLFNGSNLTASANDLEWNDRKWNIVNHFIPFTEEEVGATDRFESDFMVQYLAGTGRELSVQAKAVMNEGKKLWQAYFAHTDVRAVRDELKLNRPDVGWYQIRNALKKRNESGDFVPVSFKPFEEAYKTLTEKLQPMVYELGFLKI